MKNKLHILSLALLGLYSLVLLHNVVPHVHFDELSIKAEHVDEKYDHHHGEANHHHHQESSDDWFDILMALFGDIPHGNIGADHFEDYLAQDVVKIQVKQAIVSVCLAHALLGLRTPGTEALEPTIDPPPLLYDSSFSSSDPLRGPPSVA